MAILLVQESAKEGGGAGENRDGVGDGRCVTNLVWSGEEYC